MGESGPSLLSSDLNIGQRNGDTSGVENLDFLGSPPFPFFCGDRGLEVDYQSALIRDRPCVKKSSVVVTVDFAGARPWETDESVQQGVRRH